MQATLLCTKPRNGLWRVAEENDTMSGSTFVTSYDRLIARGRRSGRFQIAAAVAMLNLAALVTPSSTFAEEVRTTPTPSVAPAPDGTPAECTAVQTKEDDVLMGYHRNLVLSGQTTCSSTTKP